MEYKEQEQVATSSTEAALQYFLDRFYMTRISLRMLTNQHLALFQAGADRSTTRVGTIEPRCRLRAVIMEAHQNAAFLCEEYYDKAPDIQLKGNSRSNWFSDRNWEECRLPHF